MREVRLRDAKARLSAVIDQAMRGGPSVITRHGRRAAVVVGLEEWRRLTEIPSFARLLLAVPLAPGDLPERDETPLREAGF